VRWVLIVLITVALLVAEYRWPRLAWVYLAATIVCLACKALTHDWPAVALLAVTTAGWAYWARRSLAVTP